MLYMLPLDEVDETHATFRLPTPTVDVHSISDMPDSGGPVEVKMNKDEWWSKYNRAGDITVEVSPADLRSPSEIMDAMLEQVMFIADRMKSGAENEEFEASVGIFADQLADAIKWPDDVRHKPLI